MQLNYEIKRGDRLNLHCIYDSTSRTAPTIFGVESDDEMCMDFLSYYPRMEFLDSDFAHCGYFALGTSMTLCGAAEYLATGESILNVRNPVGSDMELGDTRVFGSILSHFVFFSGNHFSTCRSFFIIFYFIDSRPAFLQASH